MKTFLKIAKIAINNAKIASEYDGVKYDPYAYFMFYWNQHEDIIIM